MTKTESEIMRDAYRFLNQHADPPPIDTPESDSFWAQTADTLQGMGVKWDNHPLAQMIFPEMYLYIETKQRGFGYETG